MRTAPPTAIVAGIVVVLAVPSVPSIARAQTYAATHSAQQPPPPPGASATFEYHRDGAVEAMQAGDWDRFLDHSEQALRALPEHEDTHVARAETMQPVGVWEVDARTDEQLRRSIAILELYVAQLRQAYGEVAESRPGWAPAHQYLDDLRARLPATSEAPPAAPAVAGPAPVPPPSRAATPQDNGSSSGTAMLIGGGVATSVGGVLTITGLALIGPWTGRATDYEDLKQDHQVCNCVTKEQEAASWSKYTRARGRSLGLMVTGVVLVGTGAALVALGLRKRKQQRSDRLSLSPGGLHVRF